MGHGGTATKQMLKKISTLISLLFYGNETRRGRGEVEERLRAGLGTVRVVALVTLFNL